VYSPRCCSPFLQTYATRATAVFAIFPTYPTLGLRAVAYYIPIAAVRIVHAYNLPHTLRFVLPDLIPLPGFVAFVFRGLCAQAHSPDRRMVVPGRFHRVCWPLTKRTIGCDTGRCCCYTTFHLDYCGGTPRLERPATTGPAYYLHCTLPACTPLTVV